MKRLQVFLLLSSLFSLKTLLLEAMKYDKGSQVIIHGLKRARKYNNCPGIVIKQAYNGFYELEIAQAVIQASNLPVTLVQVHESNLKSDWNFEDPLNNDFSYLSRTAPYL